MGYSRELAMEISLTSLGSSQTLPLPHLSTLEASRFCSLRETIAAAAAASRLRLLSSPPYLCGVWLWWRRRGCKGLREGRRNRLL